MLLKPVRDRPDPAQTEVDQTAPDPVFIRLTEEIDSLQTDLAAKVKRRMAIEVWIGFGLYILFKGGVVVFLGAIFAPPEYRLISMLVGLAAFGCALHISGKFSLFGFTSKKYMPDKTREKVIEQQITEKQAELAMHLESV